MATKHTNGSKPKTHTSTVKKYSVPAKPAAVSTVAPPVDAQTAQIVSAIRAGFDRVVSTLNAQHLALLEHLRSGEPINVVTYSPEDVEYVEEEEEAPVAPAKPVAPVSSKKPASPVDEEEEEEEETEELDEEEIEAALTEVAQIAEREIMKRLKRGDLVESGARRGYLVKNSVKLPKGMDLKKATPAQLSEFIHDDYVDRAVARKEKELGLVR